MVETEHALSRYLFTRLFVYKIHSRRLQIYVTLCVHRL
jgi:hypothetical protein